MMTPSDKSYVVMGHVNLHTSDVCGGDFCRYLHDVSLRHSLSEAGDVEGMQKYGKIRQHHRNQDRRRARVAAGGRGPLQSINAHNFRDEHGRRLDEEELSTVPRDVNVSLGSALWNQDLVESTQPFPFQGVNNPRSEMNQDRVTIDSSGVNLAAMSKEERNLFLNHWQQQYASGVTGSKAAAFAFAIQEPYWQKNSLGVLDKTGHDMLYDKTAKEVRAGILASKSLELWMDPDYSNGDVVVAVWRTGDSELGTVYLVSWYADSTVPNNQVVNPILKRFLRKCEREGKAYILMGDLNGWSSLWNMPVNNPRGEILEEELVFDHNMVVLNVGDEATYFHHDGETSTIIDVSLCSSGMERHIRNWQVRDAVVTSDHASIEFTFHWSKPDVLKVHPFDFRSFKKWKDWTAALDNLSMGDSDPVWTPSKLNREVEKLYENITDSFETLECASKVERHGISKLARGTSWYSQECADLYKKCVSIRRYLDRQRKRPRNWGQAPKFVAGDLTEARREYWKAVHKNKRGGWQDFVQTREGSFEMGQFNKILKRGRVEEVNLFRNKDGTSMTPEETLSTLCSEHFPGCKKMEDMEHLFSQRKREKLSSSNEVNINDERASFITLEKIKTAVMSFGSHKGPGPDNLSPVVFKHMGPAALSRMQDIFRASYLLGVLPEKWLEIRVIFIPKAGKSSYLDPRSWRPISLMQFMMKAMEKIVIWNAQELQNRPLHNNQHGFRKGRSCDSALTSLVGRVEKTLVDHKWSFGIFLDIKGAFDNISNVSMVAKMRDRGCPEPTVGWYSDFFHFRKININYKGIAISRVPVIGSPQGGIGSPWLWNLIVDELHEEIGQITGVVSEGFADDTSLIAVARPHDTLQHTANRVQVGLDTALAWAKRHGLLFSPEKTKVMLFTRKRKLPDIPDIWMGPTKLSYSQVHKHLGIWLDTKLEFNFHIKDKLKKANGVLIRVANAMGKVWGLKPLMAIWMYRAVARPTLCYGSLVWSKVVELEWVRQKLNTFQSRALRLVGFFRKSTPLAGMEVISFTYPLRLYIQLEAARGYLRTRGMEKFGEDEMYSVQPLVKGHRQRIREWLFSLNCDLTDTPFDEFERRFVWNKQYMVDKASYDPTNKKRGKPVNDTCGNLYTDGSRLGDEQSGAGFCAFRVRNHFGKRIEITMASEQNDRSYYLGSATVFQCEVFAIKHAAIWILERQSEYSFRSLVINSDSQAAIQALLQTEVKSELVWDTMLALNAAARVLPGRLILRWNRGHVESNRGNSRADELARQGAAQENGEVLPDDAPKMAMATAKTMLHDRVRAEWEKCWLLNIHMKWPCNRTKNWFPVLKSKMSWQVIGNDSREKVSRLVQFITGHDFNNKHEFKVNPNPEGSGPWCDRCDVPGEYQTAEHLIQDCEQLGALRLALFGSDAPQFSDLSVEQLWRFLLRADIPWLPAGEV